MRITWIVGMMVLFLGGTIISQTIDYQANYMDPAASGTIWSMLHPQHVTGGSIPLIGFFIVAWNWIQAIWNALSWDYSFLVSTPTYNNPWEILRYFGWCLSVGIVVSIVLAIRGVGST